MNNEDTHHVANIQAWTLNSLEILRKSQRIMEILWNKLPEHSHFYDITAWQKILTNYTLLVRGLLNDPHKLISMQFQWWENYTRLCQQLTATWLNQEHEKEGFILKTDAHDKRFRGKEWQNSPFFAYIKQAYLLTADYLTDLVYQIEGLDPKASKQLQFYSQQFIDALSPSNFVLTNPNVLNATIESAGANLVKGLENMLEDLLENEGRFKISMTDMNAFVVGKDLAITSGKVVFENHLFQLIQYAPTTKQVYQIPLLIIPPWINKYYILDMRADNSFVKSAVDQGYTVFMISWVNPDASYKETTFDDYLTHGALAAIDVVQAISKQPKINIAAYCIGGTLLACTLAYLAQKKHNVINSATFLAALLDFSEPGDIGVFIDDTQISLLEKQMQSRGFLDGRDMALTFNTLRANDLIWSYFVSNYLEGKEPFAFDLLFWNNDAAHLPAKAHAFYLRQFYLYNKLCKSGAMILNETPLDLEQVHVSVYCIATDQDHIAPWRSVYSGLHNLQGEKRFVLGGSGHIAGIVNPPLKNKYGYRTADKFSTNPDEWYANATVYEGSWWTDWYQWLKKQSGNKTKPPALGNKLYPVIMDAPGSYVVKKVIHRKKSKTKEMNNDG